MTPSAVDTHNFLDNLSRLKSIYQIFLPLLQESQKDETIKQLDQLFRRASSANTSIIVCGEFKRGKSSIVNTIIGEDICPVDDCITTSCVSLIKYGLRPRVVRHFMNTDNKVVNEIINIESVASFSKGSSVNIDNTILLEIEIPNERLKSGLSILDTPGIGGLDPRHLSLTTFALSKADCVFFVVDAQEPLSASEISFIKDKISPFGNNIKIILNKIDLLTEEQVNFMVNDIKSKVKANGKISVIDVIPSSIYQWQLYTLTKDENFLQASNIKTLEKGIVDSRDLYRTGLLPIIKKRLQDSLTELKNNFNDRLSALTDPNPSKIAALQEKARDIANSKKELEHPSSKFNRELSSILEEAKNSIMAKLSNERIILSSSKLEDLLNSEEAKAANGIMYVRDELNKSLQKLTGQLDFIIDETFENTLEKAKISFEQQRDAEIQEDAKQKHVTLLPEDIKIRSKSVSEQLFKDTRNGMSGLGIFSATSIIGGTIFSSFSILPLAALAAIVMSVKSVSAARTAERLSEIRKQIQPRLTIAINEIQTYVQSRFKDFSQSLKDALLNRVSEMETEMMNLRIQMEECNKNIQKIANNKTLLQKKIGFIDTQLNQLNVLLNNPFIRK